MTTESGDAASKVRFIPTPKSSVMATAAIMAMRSCGGGGGVEAGGTVFWQLTHPQESLHLFPLEKHSQYFLRQQERRHLHPALGDGGDETGVVVFVSKAQGFRSNILARASLMSALLAALL